MNKRLPKLLATAFAMALSCHNLFAENWITPLADDVYVSQLSIPGTHDSATGEGFQGGLGGLFGSSMGLTQDLGLSGQWDCGIRVFDLRPTVKQEGDEMMLQIYHGILETKMSFKNALLLLRDKLIENPGEFAIVIMRHENDANKDLQGNWSALMAPCLASEEIADYLVPFKSKMTISDLRGKILVMSRDEYDKGPVGGYIDSWSHSDDFAEQRKGRFKRKNQTEIAMIQDFYELTMEGGSEKKKTTVLNLLQKSMSLSSLFWAINHTSGYTKSASSNSNRENAQNTNGAVLEFLGDENNSGRTGIIMMDFAGVDESNGYQTHGLELTKAIIAQNRRYVPKATAIAQVADDGNHITVKGRSVETDGPIAAYTISGSEVVSGTNRVTLPAKGTYIVKSKQKSRKVFVNK